MNHLEAVQQAAVEKYLLDELAPEMRDAFEEHYFDCRECMTDLQATTAFMDAARQELKSHPMQSPAESIARDLAATISNAAPHPLDKKQNFLRLIWQRPAIIGIALAACLLVMIYQNVFVYPHLEHQVAELRSPEILPALSLAGSNSRGGSTPSIAVRAAHPFLLAVDIPAEDRFASYTCDLLSPSGEILWRVPVSSEAAKDLVTIHAPAVHGNSGHYLLVVRGNAGANSGGNSGAGSIELARYAFDLSVQP